MGKKWQQWQTLFSWAPRSWWLQPWNKRRLLLGRKAMTNLDSILKSRNITLTTKVYLCQSYGFSSSHVWMWELDYKESWVLKNWCFWTVVLEKTLESPLDCKEIQPVHPKRDQSWIFMERTDAEDETPILWPLDAKNWLIWKGSDAGKDWRQEEKGMTEDEMVGWYHLLNGHEKRKWSSSVMSDSLWPVDCSPPSSSIHRILQARILEWVAISFSRGSSQPRNRTQVSHTAGRFFTVWAMRKARIYAYMGSIIF